MKRFVRLYISIVIGVVLAALIAYAQVRATSDAPASTGVAGTAIGGSLAGLTDHNGKVVTDGQFADKIQLVFFGFTHCPSICPTELQKITVVMKDLTPEQRAKIAPIFVTLDPERDSVAVMHDYLAMFDPSIIGLTGTETQINAIKKDWKVYSAKVKTEEMDSYTVDHSAYTYLRGADGRLIRLFTGTDGPDKYLAGIHDALDTKTNP